MTFGYMQPFTFKLGGTPAKVTAVRQGATEIILSDGRLVRASLQIKGISPSRQKPGSFDIAYSVVTEIVKSPDVPVHAVHETLQWFCASTWTAVWDRAADALVCYLVLEINTSTLSTAANRGAASLSAAHDQTTVEFGNRRASYRTEAGQWASAAVSHGLPRSRTAPLDFCTWERPAGKDAVHVEISRSMYHLTGVASGAPQVGFFRQISCSLERKW
jgi:hypothetical protein